MFTKVLFNLRVQSREDVTKHTIRDVECLLVCINHQFVGDIADDAVIPALIVLVHCFNLLQSVRPSQYLTQ